MSRRCAFTGRRSTDIKKQAAACSHGQASCYFSRRIGWQSHHRQVFTVGNSYGIRGIIRSAGNRTPFLIGAGIDLIDRRVGITPQHQRTAAYQIQITMQRQMIEAKSTIYYR